jgi:hypothetical protein
VNELGGPFPFTIMDGNFEQRFEAEMKALRARHDFVDDYAWAIPTDLALDVLAGLGPIVEVGAGGGYWAMLLRERGVDVLAYDREPELAHQPYSVETKPRKLWSEVLVADETIAGEHPERTLFLCWPPYDTPMAHGALAAYLEAGGQTLVFVGEDDGGCNADERFFRLRGRRMVEDEDLSVWLPQWPGIHDCLSVHRVR